MPPRRPGGARATRPGARVKPPQAEILGCIEDSIQPEIHPLRHHPQATTFPLRYPVEMRGEGLHELQEEGGLFLHPPAPIWTLTEGGGGDATGSVCPLALALRRSAAATKAPSTGLCVAGVRTCPPGPSLMRLGSGDSICWAKRGLPV